MTFPISLASVIVCLAQLIATSGLAQAAAVALSVDASGFDSQGNALSGQATDGLEV